jgi:hypothetical protein
VVVVVVVAVVVVVVVVLPVGHGLATERVGPLMQMSPVMPMTVLAPPPAMMQLPPPVSVMVSDPALPRMSMPDWLFEKVPDPVTSETRANELQPPGTSCDIWRGCLDAPLLLWGTLLLAVNVADSVITTPTKRTMAPHRSNLDVRARR